jgi:hypothetical protein
MHVRAKPADHLSDDIVERLTIGWSIEERLAMVAAQNNVIEAARNVQTRRARHPCHSGVEVHSR